jgi:hypothetical protein
MINNLVVRTFWRRPGGWNFVLDRIGYPAKSGRFTPNRTQTQETSKTNLVANSLNFMMVTHVPQSDWLFRSYGPWKLGVLLTFISGQKRYLDKFEIWAYFQWKTGRTLNTWIIEHFEQRSYVQLKLIEFTRYNFQFESISSFFRV